MNDSYYTEKMIFELIDRDDNDRVFMSGSGITGDNYETINIGSFTVQ